MRTTIGAAVDATIDTLATLVRAETLTLSQYHTLTFDATIDTLANLVRGETLTLNQYHILTFGVLHATVHAEANG